MGNTLRERFGNFSPVIEKVHDIDMDEEIEMDPIFTDMFGVYADTMYKEFGLYFDFNVRIDPEAYKTDDKKREYISRSILNKLHPEWYD